MPASAQSPAAPVGASSARADPREGVVKLERAGVQLGFGSVLLGDGRVLTALSPLGDGNHVQARYADGSVLPMRVAHSDRGWDLALLAPKTNFWKRGLSPSRRSLADASSLFSFTSLGDQNVATAQVLADGTSTLLGGDGTTLPGAIVLRNRVRDTDFGSPILDQNNDVVAVLARACIPDKPPPCEHVAYGVPVSAMKAFLKSVPPAPPPAEPWIGLRGVAAKGGPVAGVRVLAVTSGGPAAQAGLVGMSNGNAAQQEDIVVAFNDVAMATPEALEQAVHRLEVGDTAQLLVYRSGKFRQVSLTLGAAPAVASAGSPGASAPKQVPRPPR